MKILINNGPPASGDLSYVDYTRYVVDGSPTVEDSLNVSTLLSFQLANIDQGFIVPRRSAYVKVVSEIYTNPYLQPNQYYITGSYPSLALFGFSGGLGGQTSWHVIDSAGNDTGKSVPFFTLAGAVSPNNEFVLGGVCTLYVPAAGNYNFNVKHQDGSIFAIQGATVVSGPVNNNPAAQATTPIAGYAFGSSSWGSGVAAANNINTGIVTDSYVINFPTAGYYQMEYGWSLDDNLLGSGQIQFFTGAAGTTNVPPYSGGATTPGVVYLYGAASSYVLYINPGTGTYQPLYTQYGSQNQSIGLPGGPKILATGFVTNEPERTYLGLMQGVAATNILPLPPQTFRNQLYTYNIKVSSDEWLLNVEPVPFIPAFVNQTDSQILAGIANALCPGVFNTSLMASGTLIPYYQYDPTQTWSDIAKTFADANRYHYKVINKQIIYQPFGDKPLGLMFDDTTQTEKSLNPLGFTSSVVTVPPVNDCIVIGATEPQNNCDQFFVGDGFTSNFQLKNQVFQGVTSQLLSDDWTEASFSQGVWTVNDPLGVCELSDSNGNPLGSLNIIQKGAQGIYLPQNSATYIQAQNGLELGGGLNLQHGQIVFNDTASGGGGLIGALFGTSTFTPGNCVAGFGVSGQKSSSVYVIQYVQIFNGNTSLVSLNISGSLGSLQPGYVLTCSVFSNATFLNGLKLAIQTITQIAPNVWTVVAQSTSIFANPYVTLSDSGHVTAIGNDVLVTASGAAGLVIQPILNGKYVGPAVVSQINHQYVLQTWIGANTKSRYTRSYTNITQTKTYGAQNLAASGAVSFVITDVNLGNYVIEQQNPLFGLFPAAPAPVVTKYTVTNQSLPPFALYCLINGIDLNVSINYTNISAPPQGYLTVQSLTGASGGNLPWLPSQLSKPIPYQLGFGMINQTAQIAEQGEAYVLQFYTDDIPSVGARIRFQSWDSGQAIARVRDTLAVTLEGAISGDSGVRSAIMSNLSPLPRTSAECEAAAAAVIADREYPQFQGSYSATPVPGRYESLFQASLYDYPKSGEFFYANSLVRGISGQNLLVNTTRIQVVELRQEILNISVDYGPDTYLEKQLPAFLENEQNILVPTQTAKPPNYITIDQVLNAYLPTLDNATIANSINGTALIVNALTGNYIVVDLGAPPVLQCEVRNIDSGWGVADTGRIGLFTTQQFTLPRTNRDTTYFLRAISGSLYSRCSKMIRVAAPLIPASPTLVQADTSKAVFDFAGDVRDIYGLEIRATPVSGTLFYIGTPTATDEIAQFVRTPVGVSAQIQSNVLAVYNPPSDTSPFPFETALSVGDIIYTKCPGDGSFTNISVVSQVIPAMSPINAITASGVELLGGTSYFYYHFGNSGQGFTRQFPTPINVVSGVGNFTNPQLTSKINSLQWNSPNIGSGLDPSIGPMLNDIYDPYGGYHGSTRTPAVSLNGNGGTIIGVKAYDMIASGALYIPVAGNYTFQIMCDDYFLLGFQAAGVTIVSSSIQNNNGQSATVVANYPLCAAWNLGNIGGGNHIVTFTLGFATAGAFGFELDYTQAQVNQNINITVLSAPVGAILSNVPKLQSIGGSVILPAPNGLGTQAANPVPWEFGWFDYGNPAPDTTGVYDIGVNLSVGTVQQIQTGIYSFVSRGSISGNYTGICTIQTQTPHGLSVGQPVVIGCGWASWPSNLPTPPQTGTVFCGQQSVSTVIDTKTFQFILPNFVSRNNLQTWEQGIAASGVSYQLMQGVIAPMPLPQNTNSFSLASGILIQRPIFAPSDLTVDFTQPDIAEELELLQLLSANGGVGGLQAYFFNLTWDYSAPTPIPTFQVPQLINIVIDNATQQVQWQIAQGQPKGYRVEIKDPTTGITYNRFTIDHPYNQQSLSQFKLNPLDFASTRDIVITPFTALGDGIPAVITNVSEYSITGGQSPGSYSIGITWDGKLPPGYTLLRLPFDIAVQFGAGFGTSTIYLEGVPAATGFIVPIYQILNGTPASGAIQVGSAQVAQGANVGFYSSNGIVNFNPGDVMKVVCPLTADQNAADLGMVISGIKN